jgi:bifunctional aspartokinase / homoserine dehydrogenase 1
MQVLKFGGSSVANATNINRVVDIIKEKVKKDTTVVVVSALGGITDILLQCSQLAADGDERYKEKLHEAELRHLSTVKE